MSPTQASPTDARTASPHRGGGAPPADGFSLVEVLVAMAILLMVMAMAYAFIHSSMAGYNLQERMSERGMSALFAVDNMAVEIARTGYGMGSDVQRLVPGLPGADPTTDALTVRSNPDGAAGILHETLSEKGQVVRVEGAGLFQAGDIVLLADLKGHRERAQIDYAETKFLSVHSLDGSEGALLREYRAGGQVLKMREVRFHLTQDARGDVVLMKEVEGGVDQVLTRHIKELRFDYLDDTWEQIQPASVHFWQRLAGVRVTLHLDSYPGHARPVGAPALSVFVPLEPQSDAFSIENPRYGFHIRRLFSGMPGAVGAGSRSCAEVGAILASSPINVTTLYTFPLRASLGDVRIDGLVPLTRAHDPAALAFAPEDGPWSGSLFVVTNPQGGTEVWRLAPGDSGTIDPNSPVDLIMRTSSIHAVGGVAFGPDDALYLSDPTSGAIFRYAPQASDRRDARVEKVAAVDGRPGPLTRGANGSLYVSSELSEGRGREQTGLWEIGFDATNAVKEPRFVARILGRPRSLAADPLSGSLYALQLDSSGDSVLLEISRYWLREPTTPLREAFRLSTWKLHTENTPPYPGEVRIPPQLFPPSLDFASFDAGGTLYLGCSRTQLVIQAELDRPDGFSRIRFGLAGIVGQDPDTGRFETRLHAWKKPLLGL